MKSQLWSIDHNSSFSVSSSSSSTQSLTESLTQLLSEPTNSASPQSSLAVNSAYKTLEESSDIDDSKYGPLVCIVAGEVSGDNLGAGVIRELRKLRPDLRFVGIGGTAMRAEGCHCWFDISDLSYFGVVDVVKNLPKILSTIKQTKAHLKKSLPLIYIGIDSPDFNLRIAEYCKDELEIKTVQYVSPSVWAWRQGRIKTIKEATDLVLCLLPFEVEFYKKHQHPATFVGHRLANELLHFLKEDLAVYGSQVDLEESDFNLEHNLEEHQQHQAEIAKTSNKAQENKVERVEKVENAENKENPENLKNPENPEKVNSSEQTANPELQNSEFADSQSASSQSLHSATPNPESANSQPANSDSKSSESSEFEKRFAAQQAKSQQEHELHHEHHHEHHSRSALFNQLHKENAELSQTYAESRIDLEEPISISDYISALAEFNQQQALAKITANNQVALLPGSRSSEIALILPEFLKGISEAIRSGILPLDVRLKLPVAKEKLRPQIQEILEKFPGLKVELINGNAQDVLHESKFALVASGTATLDALLCHCPLVVGYRLSTFNYMIAKHLVKVEYVALSNIIFGREISKELLQDELTASNLCSQIRKLVNPEENLRIRQQFIRKHQEILRNSDQLAALAVLPLIEEAERQQPQSPNQASFA